MTRGRTGRRPKRHQMLAWAALAMSAIVRCEAQAQPTASSTPTATPTSNPTFVACVGNCDGGPAVTVDELIRGVNIALGTLPLDQCPSFDINASGDVTVEELIKGVSNALNGCGVIPPTPLPTWTKTGTPTTTATTGSTASRTPTVTATATFTATATPTETPRPSRTPTETRTVTHTPTRSPTRTNTPVVCGSFVSSVPKLCDVGVVPNPVRMRGAYSIQCCVSDLDSDVNQFCLCIDNPWNQFCTELFLQCYSYSGPVNTCVQVGPFQFTNSAGDYIANVQFRDRAGHRSEVVTAPFQAVP